MKSPTAGLTEDGLGMKAGGHWNPEGAKNHSFPWDDKGHKGDLPSLYVNADGQASSPVLAPKLKTLDEIRNRSLMIHVGGDNYHDHPAKLGGGGARHGLRHHQVNRSCRPFSFFKAKPRLPPFGKARLFSLRRLSSEQS